MVIKMGNYPVQFNYSKKLINRKSLLMSIVILIVFIFLYAGQWLVLNQEPKETDLIIVLSGADGRLDVAKRAIEEGFADKLLLTNSYGFSQKDLSKIENNLAVNAIYKDYESTSTLASALYSKKMMDENGFASAMIVSSDYHMRRVKLNFERAFEGSGMNLTYVASNSNYQSGLWWTNKYSIGVTASEYIKIVGNFVGVHGAWAKRKLYDFDNYFFS
jgi:uncharacterized SAM-binding protein YcdF (DUF218 family)